MSGGSELVLVLEVSDCSGHSLSRQLSTEASFFVSVIIRLKSSYLRAWIKNKKVALVDNGKSRAVDPHSFFCRFEPSYFLNADPDPAAF